MGKEVKVEDRFRINPLSHTPGGSVVKVYNKNGNVKVYDKVKHPKAFARKALQDSRVEKVEFESTIWDHKNKP